VRRRSCNTQRATSARLSNTAGGTLILPDAAITILRGLPRFESNPYVFAGRAGSHFNGFSNAKMNEHVFRGLAAARRIIEEWRIDAQRRDKIASMKWADVSLDGEWRVPAEEREKNDDGHLLRPKGVGGEGSELGAHDERWRVRGAVPVLRPRKAAVR
jgi:hypothetical protein